jgi:hypothetical protein
MLTPGPPLPRLHHPLAWHYIPPRRPSPLDIGIRVGGGLTAFTLLWGGLLWLFGT